VKSQFLYDEHGRQLGLNWDALKPKPTPAAQLPAPPPPKPRVLAPGNKVGENFRRRGGDRHNPERIFDYQQIADLWSQGKKNVEIREIVGCSQNTILLALRAIKPEGYTGKPGPRRKDRCKRDHDLEVHGKLRKRGGRECMKCKQERNDEIAKAKKAKS
jgi:hypothetical protein